MNLILVRKLALPVLFLIFSLRPALGTQPNVVLITLDTTRADRVGFLGSDRGLTPNLDAFARQGVVFSRAYAHVPLTTPSHATILTGTYPQFSHLRDLGDPLATEIPYLPDVLHQHGYRTAAFVGSQVLDPKSLTVPGFDRGFDVYDADFHSRQSGEDRYQSVERRAAVVVNRAVTWLRRLDTKRPFFLWVHLYDPHEPYDPPQPFAAKYAAQPYDGEIAYVDSAIGTLLRALRSRNYFETSLITVVADHGEAFGEHGEQSHGFFLYDETIHVPLLIKLPGDRAHGSRVDTRVGLVDIAPTILQEAGIEPLGAMQGMSLAPLINAKPGVATGKTTNHPIVDRPIYSETDYPARAFDWSSLRALRSGKYMYIDAPRPELYDQVEDPTASRNLIASSTAVADTMAAQLATFRHRTSGGASVTRTITPEQEGKLEALGYISSGVTQSALVDKAAGIDPKDKIETANLFHRGLLAMEDEHYADAIAPLQQVLKEEPDMQLANLELGRALNKLGNYQDALLWLMKAVKLAPESGRAHLELGMALVGTNSWQDAAPQLEAALAKAPDSSELHFTLATIYEQLSRTADAELQYRSALKLNPNDYRANLFLGRLLGMSGNPAAALSFLQKATQLQPQSVDGHKFLANVYEELGEQQNASRERDEVQRLQAKP